jgi:hypothetical protein
MMLKFDSKAFERELMKVCSTVISGQVEAIGKVGQIIIERSNEQAPMDTGTLRASGFVGRISRRTGEARVRVGYGGRNDKVNPKTGRPASAYVVYVHENLSAIHPIGNAKFLENAVRQTVPEIAALLASFKVGD